MINQTAEFRHKFTGSVQTYAHVSRMFPGVGNPDVAFLAHAGWLPVSRFVVPEGMVAVAGTERWSEYDGAMFHEFDVETIEASEQRRTAQDRTRLLGLVDAYGADIAIMGRLLAVFGLSFPCETAEVIATIKGGLATGEISVDLAPAAETLYSVYDRVHAVMTDDEIAAVAVILKGMQA